jgi:copper chaperone
MLLQNWHVALMRGKIINYYYGKQNEGGSKVTDVTVKINGMSCQHCVAAVKKALDGVEGVDSSEVSVGSAAVVFDESKTSKEAIEGVIQNAGYTVVV